MKCKWFCNISEQLKQAESIRFIWMATCQGVQMQPKDSGLLWFRTEGNTTFQLELMQMKMWFSPYPHSPSWRKALVWPLVVIWFIPSEFCSWVSLSIFCGVPLHPVCSQTLSLLQAKPQQRQAVLNPPFWTVWTGHFRKQRFHPSQKVEGGAVSRVVFN